jgi:hypothetical protein
MLMPNDFISSDLENISLEVGDVVCAGWDQVDIDSDILTPADAWSVALFGLNDYVLPATVQGGADVTLKYAGEKVLVGLVDTLNDGCGRRGRRVRISGRDLAGQLLDCSVDIYAGKSLTLEEISGLGIQLTSSYQIFSRVNDKLGNLIADLDVEFYAGQNHLENQGWIGLSASTVAWPLGGAIWDVLVYFNGVPIHSQNSSFFITGSQTPLREVVL